MLKKRSNKTNFVKIYLEDDSYRDFTEIASGSGYKKSDLGRMILERFVQQHKAARRQNGQ